MMGLENISISSLLLSFLAFFVARYYINRYLEDSGIPKGMTRNIVVFILALAVSYGVGFVVDWVVGPSDATFHSQSANPEPFE